MSVAVLLELNSSPRAFRPSSVSLRALQMGKIMLAKCGAVQPRKRRFKVRCWWPGDGFVKAPVSEVERYLYERGDYFVIIRLEDGAKLIERRAIWRFDPRGLPRDDDAWAEIAWNVMEMFDAERRQQGLL